MASAFSKGCREVILPIVLKESGDTNRLFFTLATVQVSWVCDLPILADIVHYSAERYFRLRKILKKNFAQKSQEPPLESSLKSPLKSDINGVNYTREGN